MTAHPTLSIAMVSGKGGVGKSNLSLNLAYALHNAGNRILLADCDLGLSNLDLLLGLSPETGLHNLLQENTDPKDMLIPLKKGLDLLPSASGAYDINDLHSGMVHLLLDQISPVANEYDMNILDLGAGISSSVLTFASLCKMRIVIITPEPTSLTDGYALIKILASSYNTDYFHILINQAESLQEGEDAYKRTAAACQHFLNFTPHFLGTVLHDSAVEQSVRQQKPFVEIFPTAKATQEIHLVASRIRQVWRAQASQEITQNNAVPQGPFLRHRSM